MIELYKLNGQTVFVNPDLIRFMESTPDTVLTFIDGQKIVVRDAPTEINEKIVKYRQSCFQMPVIEE